MTKIELQIHDDVVSVISKIKGINDTGIDLVVPEGSVLFDNILNLKLIEKYTEELGISVQFTTEDEYGNALIANLEGRSEATFSAGAYESDRENPQKSSIIPKISLSKLTTHMPKINFKLPKFRFSIKLIIPAIILLVGLGIYLAVGMKTPRATINIILSSLPLTRSVPIKVVLNGATDPVKSTLKGFAADTTIQGSMEIPTTGEKLVGEKAKGTVTIYNKTDEEITLKKGTQLTYETNSNEYQFTLDEEITIPANYLQSPSDPGSVKVPGEKEVDVTASAIGSAYNIDKDKSLSISKYKKSSLEAESQEKFSGGKSETKKVVAEVDKTNLSKKLLEQNTSGAEMALKAVVVRPSKLISGSTKTVILNETFDKKVGEEAEKLKLDQTATVTGLTYSDTELRSLFEKLVDTMVPEGYVLSRNDWTTTVEVLGNSTNSVLSPTLADLQITLKTIIVPGIDKDKIKGDLAGKTAGEANKYLGGIKNIKSYEVKIDPSIPLFKRVPKDISRIEVEVENE